MNLIPHIIPVLQDNYIFVIEMVEQKKALVVDPALSNEVIEFLEQRQLQPLALLNTHHHNDHIGGNEALKKRYPEMKIYAPIYDQHRIPVADHYLKDGDSLDFYNEKVQVYFCPGHTLGHIVYFFEGPKYLFCGDLLFSLGCGRLFEGSPQQMMESLKKITQLPVDTQVFCAHEYTLHNGAFAIQFEPNNSKLRARIKDCQELRALNKPTLPTSLQQELETNPFLRCDQIEILENLQLAPASSELEVFTKLRELRNHH